MIVFGLALVFTPLASMSSMGTVGNAGAQGKPTTTIADTTTTIADTTTTIAPTTTIADTTTTIADTTPTETTAPVAPPPTVAGGTVGDASPARDLPSTGPERSIFIMAFGTLFAATGMVLLVLGRRPARS